MAGELLVIILGQPSIGALLSTYQDQSDMAGAIAIMIVILVLGLVVDTIFTRVDTMHPAAAGDAGSGCGVRWGRGGRGRALRSASPLQYAPGTGPLPAPLLSRSPEGRWRAGRAVTDRTIEVCRVTAGIVLAGGRSSRMGTPKAALEWHGSTLLRRTVGILARVTDGPVVVVRAPGQDLPPLPPQTEVVEDPREGLGPVQGLAAGLAALAGRAEVAFVSSTDMPFLHPAFVRRVLRAAQDGADVGLPVARGYPQPLAASYRVALAPVAAKLVAEERLRPAFLFEECVVDRLDEAALRADPVLAALDPGLDSVVNVNEPADYQAARDAPGAGGDDPAVRAAGRRPPRAGAGPGGHRGRGGGRRRARRWTRHVVAALNGDQITRDGETPLAAGDSVFFLSADAGG